MNKHKRDNLNKLSLKNPYHLLALGFGSGLAPKAPGTVGSFAAIPFCIILLYAPVYLQILIILLSFIVGVIVCNQTEKDMGEHDNSAIVIDEFVGMFISVIAFPQIWYIVFIAYVFFRIFDVLKPYPISYLDKKIAGGIGIMLDDVLAGIYALICSHIVILLCF